MSPVILSAGAAIIPTPIVQFIPPALMLVATLVSIILLPLSSPLKRDRLFPNLLLVLNIILPAAAGGLCLGASLNHVPRFQHFSLVFSTLHACLLSISSLYILFTTSTTASLVRRTFRFTLSFVMPSLVCEIIAVSIPSSPALLAPVFSLVPRALLLLLAIGTFCNIPNATHPSTVAAPSTETNEQQRTNHEGRLLSTTSRRVSSPTPDTWPFPASLAHTPPTYDGMMLRGHIGRFRIPVIVLVAQITAIICAAFTIALAITSENAPSWIPLQARDSPKMSQYLARPSGSLKGLIIGHSVCFLIWAVAVVTGLYLLPSAQQTLPTSQKLTEGSSFSDPLEKHSEFTVHTPKPPHSRFMTSDSASDFLSMRDPFASPHPPPTVGLGLDLDRVQPYCVAPQYRFPAPKAKKVPTGGRKRRIGLGVKPLGHQASAQALLLHRPHATHASDGERSLKDEVLLAQLLLRSLMAGTEIEVEPGSPTNLAATNLSLPFPQPAMQAQPRLGSRWSASTALSVTSTPWCEKKSTASTSTSSSEYPRGSRGKSSEARKSTNTGISISSSPT